MKTLTWPTSTILIALSLAAMAFCLGWVIAPQAPKEKPQTLVQNLQNNSSLDQLQVSMNRAFGFK